VKTVYRLRPAEDSDWFDSPQDEREAMSKLVFAGSVSEDEIARFTEYPRRVFLVEPGVKGDLAYHGGHIALWSPRAAEVCGPMLREAGFLIEFEGPDGVHFGWVPREATDALDREASDVAEFTYGIIDVRTHVFDIEKIRGKDIFVLPDGGVTQFTYVGERFRETWIEHDLQGAKFQAVWSAP
jgi:hypothetical protein